MTDDLAEMGSFVHACEGEMVCESINPKIPYFNAPIYLENKVHLRICALRRMFISLIGATDGNWKG